VSALAILSRQVPIGCFRVLFGRIMADKGLKTMIQTISE
jgi:hypothetical protein